MSDTCDSERTVCAAVTSIFQHKACCLEECKQSRPPPRALSELDHRGHGAAARVAAAARAAPARWLPPRGIRRSLTTTLGNEASAETHTQRKCYKANTHTATLHQHKCQALVFVVKAALCIRGNKKKPWDSHSFIHPAVFQQLYSSMTATPGKSQGFPDQTGHTVPPFCFQRQISC